MVEIIDPIKVGLHGHILPDYGPRWKEILGYSPSDNLAKIAFDSCSRADIGIYTITDDEYERTNGRTRFAQVRDNAEKHLPRQNYVTGRLGENAFFVEEKSNPEKRIVFLAGQSLRVKDVSRKTGLKREYEMLTVGRDGLDTFSSFDEAFHYLCEEGLPAIGEHLLAYGHHGPMENKRLLEYLGEGKFTAVEHNAKLAMPSIALLIPPITKSLARLRGATKSANFRLNSLEETFEVPIIATDDSDFPEHIGAAYTEFPRDRIDFSNGDSIVRSLTDLIEGGFFSAVKNHLSLGQVMRYAWIMATDG